MKWLLIILCSISNLYAFEFKVRHSEFDVAKLGAPKGSIVFESESTKLGLITTSFEGRALEFVVKGKITKDKVSNVEVIIPVRSMTTDNSGRDEKMWDEILNAKEYPNIVVFINEVSHGFDGSIDAHILLRGVKYLLPLELKTSLDSGVLKVSGEGHFSLKAWKIPDPSIAIASVRDVFDFKFTLEFK